MPWYIEFTVYALAGYGLSSAIEDFIVLWRRKRSREDVAQQLGGRR